MTKFIQSILILAFVFVLNVTVANAQTTEFTYQGSLNSSGTTASGDYDFEFVLYDSTAGGNPYGPILTRGNVPVFNGVFSVKIDFGDQFNGGTRYLEIRVRQTGGGAYTPLAPRQKISSLPYSIKSLKAENAVTASNAIQLGGVAADQYVLTGDSRLSNSRTPLPGSGNYIQNTTGLQLSSGFYVSGTGRARIISADTYFALNDQRVISAFGTKNFFVGTEAGKDNTSGRDNAFFGAAAGSRNLTGSQNSFFGTDAGAWNFYGSNQSFFGFNAGRNISPTSSFITLVGSGTDANGNGFSHSTAIGADAVVSGSNVVKLGRIQEKVIAPGTLRVGDIGDNFSGRGDLALYSNSGNADFYMQGFGSTVGINIAATSSGSNNPELIIAHYNGSTYDDRIAITPRGRLKINYLGPAGITSLCRNADNEVATCVSSIKYKSNITDFMPGIDLIKKLRPVSFDWKEGGMRDMGLVAEEVAAAEPLLTTKNDKGEVEGVKYDRVGVVLVNAVQEQQVQIDDQKIKIENQRQKIELLEKELKGLKTLICAGNPSVEVCRIKEN